MDYMSESDGLNDWSDEGDSRLWDILDRIEEKEAKKKEANSKPKSKTVKIIRGQTYQWLTCQCGVDYRAKTSDLMRGWGLSCSKSCAAKRRESKVKYVVKFK